jgi:hypothetical protein
VCSACPRPPPPSPHNHRLQFTTSQFSLDRPRPIPRVPSAFVYTCRSLLPGHSWNNSRIEAQGWASQVAVVSLIKFTGTERSVREGEAESLTNVTVPPALVPADGNNDDDAAFDLELPQPQFSQSDAHFYPHTLTPSHPHTLTPSHPLLFILVPIPNKLISLLQLTPFALITFDVVLPDSYLDASVTPERFSKANGVGLAGWKRVVEGPKAYSSRFLQ